jgi:hypothetical protein
MTAQGTEDEAAFARDALVRAEELLNDVVTDELHAEAVLEAIKEAAAAVPQVQAVVTPSVPVSERHALMLQGIAEMKEKAKKTLSPEHLAKMKAGREAAKLKKQLEASPSSVAAAVELMAASSAVPTPLVTPSAAAAKDKKGHPTAWADWVKKMMVERKDEIAAYKETAEQKAGAGLKWIATNMGKESAEWKAFKAQWAQAHAKPAELPAPLVVEVPTPVLLVAEVPAVDDSAAADTEPESDNEPVVTPPIKKRGPKPLASMTPAERAVHDAKVAERKAAKEAKAAAAATALTLVAAQSVGGAANSAE